jgi:hypothetical protein
MDWTNELDKQLSWHWENALRPRLDGLTDQEYFWEPVPGMWSVRSGRIARHFGGPAISHATYVYPSTAADALARLDDMYAQWIAGVRSLMTPVLPSPAGSTGSSRIRWPGDPAHPPRGDPSRCGDLPATRPVPVAELMTFVSSAELLTLHGVRILGMADTNAVSRRFSWTLTQSMSCSWITSRAAGYGASASRTSALAN